MTIQKKALVIGNDLYDQHRLMGCCNDAIAIKELLDRNADDSPNFDTWILENAASTDIKQGIISLFEGNCEIALLYFSGHGTNAEGESGIIGTDYNIVPFNFIMPLVQKSKHRHKILIFDSCFSGAAGNNYFCDENTAALPSGVTIMSACRNNETAVENNKHGLFTSLLIDALNGGASSLVGDISPGAIYAYIDRCLGSWDQRPVFKTHVDSFCSIRKSEPPISLSILRKLPDLFPDSDTALKLNPSFEETNAPTYKHKVISPYADSEKVAIFKELQQLVHVGLVTPCDTEHMYYAAMESKSCKLTPLGIHYRELASHGKL